jgi:hypothetical protein
MYDAVLNIQIKEVAHRYVICGVIHLHDHHFTSRLIKTNGAICYHDGILTGSTCEHDGILHTLPANFLNSCNINGEISEAVGVVYARVS